MIEPYGIDKSLGQTEVGSAFANLTAALNSGKDLDLETLWIFSSGLAKYGSASPQGWLDLGKQIVMGFGWPHAGIVIEGIMESGDLAYFREIVFALKRTGKPSIADFVGKERVKQLHAGGRITNEMRDQYLKAGSGIDWE